MIKVLPFNILQTKKHITFVYGCNSKAVHTAQYQYSNNSYITISQNKTPSANLHMISTAVCVCSHVVSHCHCFLECRTMEHHRHGARGEEFDYPPMDPVGFSPSPHPPPWQEPPPPYEVAIKTTCSSTQLRRAYSDTHLASEPLFGRSREISFEVWSWIIRTVKNKESSDWGFHSKSCLLTETNFIKYLKHASSWCWPVGPSMLYLTYL